MKPRNSGECKMVLSGPLKSPLSGNTPIKMIASHTSATHPVRRNPLRSKGVSSSIASLSTPPLYFPKRGSTHFSATHVPKKVIRKVEAAMK